MRTLKKPWTAGNQWLLKEAATALFPDRMKQIRDQGEACLDNITISESGRLVIGSIRITELLPAGKNGKRYPSVRATLLCAFFITKQGKFFPISVDEEEEEIDE